MEKQPVAPVSAVWKNILVTRSFSGVLGLDPVSLSGIFPSNLLDLKLRSLTSSFPHKNRQPWSKPWGGANQLFGIADKNLKGLRFQASAESWEGSCTRSQKLAPFPYYHLLPLGLSPVIYMQLELMIGDQKLEQTNNKKQNTLWTECFTGCFFFSSSLWNNKYFRGITTKHPSNRNLTSCFTLLLFPRKKTNRVANTAQSTGAQQALITSWPRSAAWLVGAFPHKINQIGIYNLKIT